MKKVLYIAMTLCLSLLASCGSNDDVKTLSNYEAKLKAVSDEVAANKKSNDALLLVTFGSTWDSPQQTFKAMKQQFKEAFPNRDVYFAFTSNICITRCAAKGWEYYDPTFYLKAIGNAGYHSVAVQSLHIIPGEEYLNLQSMVKAFHYSGDSRHEKVKVYLGSPLLAEEDDVKEVAKIMNEKMKSYINEGKMVTFMGHGNPETMNYGNGNTRYTMMEKELQKLNPHYYVATVDMEDNFVGEMIDRMKTAGIESGNVVCHPLMSIAGDHANNDMKGGVDPTTPEEESWRYELTQAGYTCPLENCIIKGLADYPEIVKIWINHTKYAIDKGSLFEE